MKQKNKTKYKVWDKRYDFSEINKLNYHEVFREYFKLTTKKITLMAMFLVLTIVFGLISQYALTLIPVGGFLTFNITIWIIMIAYLAFNFFYSFLFLEVTIWFRLAYNPQNFPGVIAMNLNDLTFLIFLALLVHLINYVRFQFQTNYEPHHKRITYFWTLMIAMIIATFLTSAVDVGYNYGFLITFYNTVYNLSFNPGEPWLLITIFWFNLAQSAINIVIFASLYKVCYSLINFYFL